MIELKTHHINDVLQWALESTHDPSLAAADWLARDIDPEQPSAVALITDPMVSLAHLKQAKSVFKALRIMGEHSADRRVAARLYLAAIAAALVRHDQRISTQSNAALARSLRQMRYDSEASTELQRLAGAALSALNHSGEIEPDSSDDTIIDYT